MLETLLERMKDQGRRTGRAGQEGRVAGGGRRLVPDPGAARPNITRQNARQFQGLGRDLLLGTFGAKPGAPFVARGPQGGYLVAVVEKVHPGSPDQMAQITEAMRPQTSQGLFRDVGQAAQDAAKTQLKTKVNLTLARQAIGVDTSALPKGDGKAAAKTGKAQ
jgi:peptidyl-prolyl cis-trans isomerase D